MATRRAEFGNVRARCGGNEKGGRGKERQSYTTPREIFLVIEMVICCIYLYISTEMQ